MDHHRGDYLFQQTQQARIMNSKWLNWFISRIPISIFLLIVIYDLAVHLFPVSDSLSFKLYLFLGQLFGNSLLNCLFMVLIIIRLKLCLYNKISVFGLFILNVVNIVFILTDRLEDNIYSYVLLTSLIWLLAILAVITYITEFFKSKRET